jgi:long-chain acyl-CoA synthetase
MATRIDGQARAVVTEKMAPAGPTELFGRTLPGRVAQWASEKPDAVAIRYKDLGIWKEISWAGYLEALDTVAHGLRHLGVGCGDTVAILSENSPEWVFVDLAAQGIGACSAGIYQTNPAEDVGYVLDHSCAKVLFCEDQEQVDKAIEVRGATPSVQHVVVIDPRGTRGYDDPRLLRWSDFYEAGVKSRQREPGWFTDQLALRDPDRPSMLIYTSGTTGQPKGAQLSSANAMTLWDQPDPLRASPDDVILSYLPLCHVAEKLFTLFIALRSGCVVHFGESIETVQDDLREVSPTLFLGVPRIWEKIHATVTIKMKDSSWLKRTLFEHFARVGRAIAARRLAGRDTPLDRVHWFLGDMFVYRPLQERLGLRRCRIGMSAAAPVAPELLYWFWSIGIPIYEGYGLSEATGVTHMNTPGAIRMGSVGRPISGLESHLTDDGEVLIRGPSIFCGYLRNPDATAQMIDSDGWLHTGDIGVIDEEGFLTIVGRKKEIIITSGGKNISPEKVENALKLSPYVKEAVAIGDSRKFVSALIQIDYEIAGDWALRRGIGHSDYADLAARPEIEKLVKMAVDEANDHLAPPEQVRAFRILPKELHQDDGEMTPTRKVRRRIVVERFSELTRSIYGGT